MYKKLQKAGVEDYSKISLTTQNKQLIRMCNNKKKNIQNSSNIQNIHKNRTNKNVYGLFGNKY